MRNKLLQKLRELYIKKELKHLEEAYTLGKWMLLPEDKEKIEKAIEDLKLKQPNNSKQHIEDAIKLLGVKI